MSHDRQSFFGRAARGTADALGSPFAFFVAVLAVLAWAASGPAMGYSERWQLVINTGTTILTFLMVFVIQNTQDRDTRALQIKLDELLRVTKGAHKSLLDLEELEEGELREFQRRFEQLAERARQDGDDPLPPEK